MTMLAWSLASVAACAHTGTATPSHGNAVGAVADSSAQPAALGPVVLQVDNRSTYDVIIYAVRGTLRRRIGSVAGVSQTTIKIPDTFTSDRGGVAIAAVRLAGNETYLSDSVVPQGGERLVLTVQPRVVDSALSVR